MSALQALIIVILSQYHFAVSSDIVFPKTVFSNRTSRSGLYDLPTFGTSKDINRLYDYLFSQRNEISEFDFISHMMENRRVII